MAELEGQSHLAVGSGGGWGAGKGLRGFPACKLTSWHVTVSLWLTEAKRLPQQQASGMSVELVTLLLTGDALQGACTCCTPGGGTRFRVAGRGCLSVASQDKPALCPGRNSPSGLLVGNMNTAGQMAQVKSSQGLRFGHTE